MPNIRWGSLSFHGRLSSKALPGIISTVFASFQATCCLLSTKATPLAFGVCGSGELKAMSCLSNNLFMFCSWSSVMCVSWGHRTPSLLSLKSWFTPCHLSCVEADPPPRIFREAILRFPLASSGVYDVWQLLQKCHIWDSHVFQIGKMIPYWLQPHIVETRTVRREPPDLGSAWV